MDDFQFYAFISAFSSFGAKGIGQGVQLLEEQLLRGIPILESKRDWSPEYV